MRKKTIDRCSGISRTLRLAMFLLFLFRHNEKFLELDATQPLSARLASTSSTEILQQHRGPMEHCLAEGRGRKCSVGGRTNGTQASSPSNLRPLGRIWKNSLGNIFHGVYPVSFRTRTSTSLPRRRYDISPESTRCQ